MLQINPAIVYKKFTFDSSHMLQDYKGKCSNLHGHTYKLEVGLFHPENKLPEDGMVVDFNIMKSKIGELVELFDHSYLYCVNSPQECRIADLLQSMGKRVTPFEKPTTCENLAEYIFDTLSLDKLNVYNLVLYETPTSYCIYNKKDWSEYKCQNK